MQPTEYQVLDIKAVSSKVGFLEPLWLEEAITDTAEPGDTESSGNESVQE